MTRETFNVSGMSCGHCKAAVEEELAKLEGVEEPVADFEKGTVGLRYDEATVTKDDI
jgi:copper chaperone